MLYYDKYMHMQLLNSIMLWTNLWKDRPEELYKIIFFLYADIILLTMIISSVTYQHG